MRELLCQLVLYFEIILWIRVILSWFPISPGGVMARINGLLVTITEPLMAPVRRLLPRTGGFDLSPIIVFLVLEFIVRGLILGCYR
jgi:YggT family protein